MESFSPSLALPRFPSKLQAQRRRAAAEGKRPQCSSTPASGYERTTDEELFESFLRGRQDTGDFISKASDKIWRSQLSEADMNNVRRKLAKIEKLEDPARRFNVSSTMNQAYLARQKEKDEKLRAGLLEYEALKRELSLMTVLVGLACGAYCVVVFSIEVAANYGLGVLGSLLYLQLLGYHVDRVSEESVPHIFLEKRKRRRIGITSKDLQSSLTRNLQGLRLALLSPRLLIPTALYGVWLASKHQDTINVQIPPMMLGFFAYKAAALIQAFRDNQGLLMTFPQDYDD